MKKFGLFVLSLASISLIWNTTQAKEYEYTNLDITANILDDGTMSVKENYTADFFVNKHGIIRDIPLNYVIEGQQFHINVLNIYVDGKKFSTSNNNGNIEIKIGDANKTLIGEQNYPISYSTYGLIRNFSGMGYAELYWNLVGYDFDTNINNVKAEIFLPKKYTGFNANDFLITTDGSIKTVNEFGGTIDRKGGNKITITYDKRLPAYQGITLAIKFPNNYFTFDDERQAELVGKYKNNIGDSISNFISSSLGGLLEFFGFIAIIIIAIKKFKNKDSKIDTKSGVLSGEFAKQFPVIVQYTPPQGLTSAEVGLLLHREAQARDILSLIYKRASEGLINISTEKTEGSIFSSSKDIIIITKNKDISEERPEYEKAFFKSLVRSEKNKIEQSTNLYSRLSISDLEHYGKSKGRLTKKNSWKSAVCLGIVGAYFLTNFLPTLGILLLIGLAILLKFIGGGPKLKETQEGAKLISHILGYREFLSACDENKLRLFLQQDPLYFDKILPYAVVFGLETELLKKITPIMQEMQIQSRWGNINSIYIINNTISSVASHSLPPSASYSSSGGFSSGSSFGGGFSSGGGGGGGGGRSW